MQYIAGLQVKPGLMSRRADVANSNNAPRRAALPCVVHSCCALSVFAEVRRNTLMACQSQGPDVKNGESAKQDINILEHLVALSALAVCLQG